MGTRIMENKLESTFKEAMNEEIKMLAKSQDYYCEDITLPDIVCDDADAEENPEEDIDGITIFDINLRDV
jgi:hypothetical protein